MQDVFIEVEDAQQIVEIDVVAVNLIKESIQLSLQQEAFGQPCEVFVTLVSNDEIQEINREQRSIDQATDVLSFPMLDMLNGSLKGDVTGDVNPETGRLVLGDIIISTEKMINQAKEYEHSFQRELAFLTTHGLYHLLGYDHENSEQEKIMIGKQELVLKAIGLNR